MHDYAWGTEAGLDHDDFLYARLLPHAAKDARRIPHAHETLALLSRAMRFNSLFPDLTRIYLYLISLNFGKLFRRGDSPLWGH